MGVSKMLWIGSYVPEEEIAELNRMGYTGAASYLSQRNLVEGLEYHTGRAMDSIGAVVLPDFPKCGVLLFRRRQMKHSTDSGNVLVGFLNVKFINRLITLIALTAEARRWAMKYNGETAPDIFVYEMRSACLRAAMAVKRIIPSARVHLIVPDLPMFLDLSMGPVKRCLKKMDDAWIRRHLDAADTFVLYAEPMAKHLGIEARKWMRMEGSVNICECGNSAETESARDPGMCIAMYSGYLERGFGLLNLCDAFDLLDDGYELWITGGGPLADELRKRAARNPRIRFFGFLTDRAELLRLQRQATVMVNMRDPDAPASAYCFPSKIYDALLMEKPVLSCRLPGIPEEYFEHMIGMKSIDPADIAEAIRRAADMPPDKGRRGAEFVAREKNNLVQAKRILDFIAQK